ncbi:MAG: ribonuclease P protein component 1 [Halobacteriota archaeon]
MALTPETLTRHELNGLQVRVVEAQNPDLVGIAGRVVRETMRTLCIEGDDARVRTVPKDGTTFEFVLTDEYTGATAPQRTDEAATGRKAVGSASKPDSETAGVRSRGSGSGEGPVYVTVDGARLLSRPAHRTENAGESTWR